MPSHGTSSSINRPRRAKSTSSIKSRQTFAVNPETIDQHALTAAALAFERANGRAMAFRTSPGQEPAATSSADGPHLARKQSVRFVGPTAMPTRQRSITRREAPDYRSSVVQSQKGAFEEDYLDSEVASMPSSYKRIRKAKSMYSPRKAPSFQSTHGTPRTRFHSRSHSEQSSDGAIGLSQLPKPSLRRSFSFLQGKTDQLSSNVRQNTSTDAAVQMARDQYLRQIEQQRLSIQPSILTLGKRRNSQKAFRRTVRTSSTNSYGSAVASAAPAPTEPNITRGLGDRARSISCSLKTKLKRVFHRPSETHEVMPVQQLDAKRPHFGDYKATSSGLEQRYEGIPSPDGEALRRVSSRESSSRNSPVILDKGSPVGSVRSARSDDSSSNGKSRVTSWTSSTAANTLSSRQKRERKRLSVIQENGGPYQPSSSVRHYGEPGDAFTAFRKPVRNYGVAGHKRGLVDSQRIYSALQRRLSDKGRQALDEQDPGTANTPGQARFHLSDLTPRRSSINSRRDTSNSLRHKDPKYSPDSPRGIESSKSLGSKPLSSGNVGDIFTPRQGMSPQGNFDTQMDLTLRNIAQSKEAHYPTTRQPLREVKSGFFPSNMRLERSTTSPFRRAMHAGSESEANTEADFQSPEQPVLQPRRSIYGFPNGSVTGSESVYSRTSGGDTPKPTESSFSLVKSESSGEAGTAFIVSRQSENYHESRRPFAQRNLSETKSSGDWQSWMVSQVANLESRGTGNTKKYDACPLKEIGHKRENAQLDDDDLALGKLPRSVNAPKQPLAIVHSNLVTRPTLEHRTSYSMIDRFPLLDIAPASNILTLKQGKTTPNDLNEAQVRPSSNVENERYSSSLNRPHAMSADLRNKVSSTTIRSQLNGSATQRYETKGFNDSPDSQGTLTPPSIPGNVRAKTKPKTPSRHSPERLARLRRMRSSDSPGFPSTGESPSCSAKPQNQVNNADIPRTLLRDSRPEDVGSGGDRSILATDDTTIPGSQKMVDLFLGKRRKNMKSSEDSEGDPAFL